jgi:hypothetical protein
MVLSDQAARAAGQAGTPVLGRNIAVQIVYLPESGQAVYDKLPGAVYLGTNLAFAVFRAPAGPVQKPLGTPCHRADAAEGIELAIAASGAFFGVKARFLEYPYKRGIYARQKNSLCETPGQDLHACSASQRQHGIVTRHRLGRLLYESIFTLTFNRKFFGAEGLSLLSESQPQRCAHGGDLVFAARETCFNARAATENEDLIVRPQHFLYLGDGFLFSDYHSFISIVVETGTVAM